MFIQRLPLFYMFMRKQMILTVLIISFAAGTITKFQRRIILLRTATDGTAMDRSGAIPRASHIYCLFKLLLSVNLSWIHPTVISGHQKIDQHIHQRTYDHDPGSKVAADHIIGKVSQIQPCQIFDLQRNNKIQKHLHIWISNGKQPPAGLNL